MARGGEGVSNLGIHVKRGSALGSMLTSLATSWPKRGGPDPRAPAGSAPEVYNHVHYALIAKKNHLMFASVWFI